MASSRFDPQPPDKSATGRERQGSPGTMAIEAGAPEGIDLLQIIGSAEQISRDYQQRTIQRPLSRAYRAWHNEHAEGSKYLGTAWKGRSRLFVPKTRSAVRKNLATAAGALFSTEDVVNVSAQFEDDDQQRATAATIKADLDYRLTRAGGKSGIPWFQIAMGGAMDSQLTGVVMSKQYWEYEEVATKEFETVQVPVLHPDTGEELFDPVLHPETGEHMKDEAGDPQYTPLMQEGLKPVMKVVRDRPMSELIPIENIGLDPAAPWYSPAQLGRWLYCRYPMGLADVRALMASGGKDGQNAWLDVPDELLMKGRTEEDRAGSRRVREGGSDRYQDAQAVGELDIVWIQENFVRVGGDDYHFWSIGRHGFISKVRTTREAYPAFDGERPYVFGVAQLDTHRVFPMSPVESWQPLQLELNDITNLRQDTLKRAIAPLAKVKRGKNVDLVQLQRRGQPDAVLMVDALDDVDMMQTPGPSGAAYTETSVNNAMFDELAGVFSTSSVQSNRQLNETVGGMRLMSGAANAVSEFDLRMWVETWVEPVLRQLTHLVRHYESDERILAVAGQKARVWTRFKYMPSLSDFEQADVTLRVNVGIGALDPMQRLAKLKMAGEMLAPMFPIMQAKGITPNVEAFIEEVMGHAGFKDGRRFFEFDGQPPQQQPDPETQKAMAELQFRQQELQTQVQQFMAGLQSKERLDAADNRTNLEVANIRAKSAVTMQIVDALAERDAREHSLGANREERYHDLQAAHIDRLGTRVDAEASRQHEKTMSREAAVTSRRARIEEILAKRDEGTGKGSSKPSKTKMAMPGVSEADASPDMTKILDQLDTQGKALQAIMKHLIAGQQTGAFQPNAGAPYPR